MMMKDYLRSTPTWTIPWKRPPSRQPGAKVPARFATTSSRMAPASLLVLNLDIWGEDIDDSPLVFEQGDADGLLKPTERGFMPMPWLEAPTALLPIWMFRENGQPYDGDPRHCLRAVVDRFKAKGLTPVCAMELEFFLIDDSGKTMQVPASPRSGKRRKAAETLSIRALDAFTFLTDIYDACAAMDSPPVPHLGNGLGQFEVKLMHCDDALRAPRACSSRCGQGLAPARLAAPSWRNPMPYSLGAATHFPILDEKGEQSSTRAARKVPAQLRYAVAGCRMPCTFHPVFAPHSKATPLVPTSTRRPRSAGL